MHSASTLLALGLAAAVAAHGNHQQQPIEGPHQSLWYNTLPGDGGTQVSLLRPLVDFSSALPCPLSFLVYIYILISYACLFMAVLV